MALVNLQLLAILACLFNIAEAFENGCKDKVDEKRCREVKLKRGCDREDMMINCARTCQLCYKKAPSPPKKLDCAQTTYGCCWDNKTPRRGYEDEGCPPCKDDKIFQSLCVIWEKHCHNKTNIVEHKVVSSHCHRTCKKCTDPKPKVVQKLTVRTLPPADESYLNSDEVARKGAFYIFTSVRDHSDYRTQ
ncbi:uncharacterized protein LOC124434709 isoform X2 [Xenia sp. Carnegie-2017]|uniref:uncharacterized protein LOC124434709 isoform X2 n=1 Tax=Xenia sp. Carnegie-2017 TaxID=2897299 RepID=UPI001F04C67F|nr:uncharacterized protein LOC124434709 isoform X2 [Xenia sp. Carnegie-2017]